MGSKGDTTSSSQTSVVCCMCGDHGLPRELFRCKVCLVRSQHKYCSDLYPRAESYRACNWCLREEAGKSSSATAGDQNSPLSSSSNNTSGNSNNSSSSNASGVKLHRAALPPHLNEPVKKPRLPGRSASDVVDRMRSEELSPTSGRSKQAFRGRVRRYKLLEEVSS